MPDIASHWFRQVNRQLQRYSPANARPVTSFEIAPVLTLVAHIPDGIGARLQQAAQTASSCCPNQYVYALEQYHLTLVPLGDNRRMSQADLAFLQKVLTGQSFEVSVCGLALNPFGVFATGYPDISARPLRDALRARFGSSLNYSTHNTVWEELFWTGLLRFRQPINNQLVEAIRCQATADFGSYTIREWSVYRTTSKVLDPAHSQLVASIQI